MSKNNIEACKNTFFNDEIDKSFFRRETTLRIPAYQRPYSWKKDNVAMLLKDFLKEIKTSSNPNYFIGTIMVKRINENNRNFEDIVDGQQRITTILLIIFWIKNQLPNDRDLNDKHNILIKNFSMSYPDDDIFKQIIKKNTNNEILTYLKKTNKEFNVFQKEQQKVFKNSFNTINKILLEEDSNTISKLREFIFNKIYFLKIADTCHDDFSDTLFLSLNGKGLKLDEVDLLKSYFVRPFIGDTNELNDFKDKWGQIITYTNNKLNSQIKNFFSQYFDLGNKKKQIINNIIKNIDENKDKDVKSWFNDMYIFFKNTQKYFIEFNSDDPEFNFYLKLNKLFKYSKCDQILKPISLEFKNDKEIIKWITKHLFKLNFLIVTYSKISANCFEKDIIKPLLNILQQWKGDIKKSIKEIYYYLIDFDPNNIYGDKLKNISDFAIENYSYTNQKEMIILSLLLDNQSTWIDKSRDYDYFNLNNLLQIQQISLDHVIPQKNAKLYNHAHLFTNTKDKVNFNYPIKDIFSPQLIHDYSIIQDRYDYSELKKILDSPFNLQICEKTKNSKMKNNTPYNLKEVKERFDYTRIWELNFKLSQKIIKFIEINENIASSAKFSLLDNFKKIENSIKNYCKSIDWNEYNSSLENLKNELIRKGKEFKESFPYNFYSNIYVLYDRGDIDETSYNFLIALNQQNNSIKHDEDCSVNKDLTIQQYISLNKIRILIDEKNLSK